MSFIDWNKVDPIIDFALKEDIGESDITTDSLIPKERITRATMTAKDNGIIAGLPIAERVFRKIDPNIKWDANIKDGDSVKKGDVLVSMEGSFRALLTGERVALNFLQHLSGIATATSEFVELVKDYKAEILDTRKTTPGLRHVDKYAVKMGGGTNHRIGLFDRVMIKDNHIKVAGSITNAVNEIRPKIKGGILIEVETTNLDEVREALAVNTDIIMLDNMDNATMTEAVEIINGKSKVEASGNMNLERIISVAETGVDYISIGSLTHSVTALDISQNIEN